MTSTPDATPAPAAPLATLMVATCNTLNLALAGQETYPNQSPLSSAEFALKADWLGAQIGRLNADIVGLQEVWHEAALRQAVERSGLRYATVTAPGAEQGAQGTPRLALVTRLAVDGIDSVSEFDATDPIVVPDLGAATRFERPVLHAQLRMKHGQRLHVLVAHLKSKRPKFLQDADGRTVEDTDDPGVAARAALRSRVMRGAEALALRRLVIGITHRTCEPQLLLGERGIRRHFEVRARRSVSGRCLQRPPARRPRTLAQRPRFRARPLEGTHARLAWPQRPERAPRD